MTTVNDGVDIPLREVVGLEQSVSKTVDVRLVQLQALHERILPKLKKGYSHKAIRGHSRAIVTLPQLTELCAATDEDCSNAEEGEALAVGLLENGFFVRTKPFSHIHDNDFTCYPFRTPDVLNTARQWPHDARPAVEVANDVVNKLFEVYLSGAQHETLSASAHYRTLELLVSELQAVRVDALSEKERKCFFINCYNSLSMHSHIAFGDISSAWKRRRFFNTPKYLIGGHTYTLSDIQNGILRGNQPGHTSSGRPFSSKDARAQFVCELDARVMFALNNGASSSPVVRSYDPESLDEELRYSVVRYLHRNVTVDAMKNIVVLPILIKWYRRDLPKGQDELLGWISQYMTTERRDSLQSLIGTPTAISYKPFDWRWSFALESEQEGVSGYQLEDNTLNSTLLVEIVKKDDILQAKNEVKPADVSNSQEFAKKSVVQLLASEYDRKVRRYNLQILLIAIAGIILNVVELEYAWQNRNGTELGDNAVTQTLKGVQSFVTLGLLIRLFNYYKYQQYLEVRKFGFREHFGLGVKWSSFFVEALICVIHAPPFLNRVRVNGTIIFTDRIGVFSLMRLYLVARVMRDHSELYQSRKELVSSKGGRMSEVHALSSFSMTIKYLFQAKPTRFLLLIYTLMATMLAYAVYVAERENQPNIFNYGNALWFTVVTMTTVGYGDLSVESWVARIAAFLSALIGVVMSSMIFAAINQKLQPTLYQKYALKWMQDNRFDKASRHLAASIVQVRWRYWKFSQTKHSLPDALRYRMESIFKLKGALARSRFRRMRSDQRIGTRYETFMDFTDVHILKRIQLVDSHLSARFHWLEQRLHAMMVDLLGDGGRPRTAASHTSRGTHSPTNTYDTLAHDSTYSGIRSVNDTADMSEHLPPSNKVTTAKVKADIIRAKTQLPTMESTNMLTVHRNESASAAMMRQKQYQATAATRGGRAGPHGASPLAGGGRGGPGPTGGAQRGAGDAGIAGDGPGSDAVPQILSKLLSSVDTLSSQVKRLETRVEDVQTSIHHRRRRGTSSAHVHAGTNENQSPQAAGKKDSAPSHGNQSPSSGRPPLGQSSPARPHPSQASSHTTTTPQQQGQKGSQSTSSPVRAQGTRSSVASSAGPPLLPHQAKTSGGPEPIPELVKKSE